MNNRPVLLDLFCGSGGAAMGYHRAGFDVIGVDLYPQPNYPFRFVRGDALTIMRSGLIRRLIQSGRIAAIHASPPCQRWSAMAACRPDLAAKYPDLITPVRPLLEETGLPYVIENVPGAPLHNPIMLCGWMFGYELVRHRLFESNIPLVAPLHLKHLKPTSKAGHWKPGTVISVSGNCAPVGLARKQMAIGWCNRDELAEAIPPYYTKFIGAQIMQAIEAAA